MFILISEFINRNGNFAQKCQICVIYENLKQTPSNMYIKQ